MMIATCAGKTASKLTSPRQRLVIDPGGIDARSLLKRH